MRLREAYALREAAARRSMERIRSDRRGAPVDVGRALGVLEKRLFDTEMIAKRLMRDCEIRDNAFSGRFRQHCQQPPATYITDRRLETAASLLTNSQLTVSKIGELVGYGSLQVFSDAFERWSGMRPSVYRKQTQRLAPLVRAELLDAKNIHLLCSGKLDADVAQRLIDHLQDLYGSKEVVAPRTAATAISEGERKAAEGYWRALEVLSFAEQRDMVRRLPLRSAALFHLLRQKSRLIGRQDRERGVQLAELALESLYATGRKLPHKELLDLEAQGWAWLGNAQRLALDFAQADESFTMAAVHLPKPLADPAIMAEYYELLASLRWYQRKIDAAVELQDRAVLLQREIGDPDALAKALIVRGNIRGYGQASQHWNTDLKEAVQLLDHARQPYLSLAAHFRLALGHFFAGDHQAAQSLLPQVQTLASQFPDTSAMLSVQWLQGLLCHARGDGATAAHLLEQVYESFRTAEDAAHMAMAGIDLAATQLERRNFAAARSVCLEILPRFQALQNHDTFAGALILLQQALSGQQLEAVLLHEIQLHLRGLHLEPLFAGPQPASY